MHEVARPKCPKCGDWLVFAADDAAKEKRGGWIEIKEGCEMPKDFEDVFVLCGSERVIAWRDSDDPHWYETYAGSDEPLLNAVSHWHPFPPTPPDSRKD